MTQNQLKQIVVLKNIGVSGAKTGDVLRIIDHPNVQAILQQVNLISITAGGNDLIDAAKKYLKDQNPAHFYNALVQCKENYSRILGSIRNIKSRSKSKYIIRVTNLYNPFPQISQAVVWVQQFNLHIKIFQGSEIAVANLYEPFLGREKELLSFDHIHPNFRGYQVIAQQLHSLGYDSFS